MKELDVEGARSGNSLLLFVQAVVEDLVLVSIILATIQCYQ